MTSLRRSISTFRTENRHGYSVQFSPFFPSQLVCAASENFGIKGHGNLFFLEITPEGQIVLADTVQWLDGLFDVCWSETNPAIALSSSGDGSIQLWNISCKEKLLTVFREHLKEVYSINWNQCKEGDLFISGSWDQTIKLWNIGRQKSIHTFLGHSYYVYDAVWSPHIPGTFASASGDGTLRIWDVKVSNSNTAICVPAQKCEILSCDWNKYNQNLIATGATDGSILGWDLRNPHQPVFILSGHNYAVKRVKFSPFHENKLASCSYDFTTRIWNTLLSSDIGFECETFHHHTEFVYGLDFNLHIPGQVVDCAWDQLLHIFQPNSLLKVQFT